MLPRRAGGENCCRPRTGKPPFFAHLFPRRHSPHRVRSGHLPRPHRLSARPIAGVSRKPGPTALMRTRAWRTQRAERVRLARHAWRRGAKAQSRQCPPRRWRKRVHYRPRRRRATIAGRPYFMPKTFAGSGGWRSPLASLRPHADRCPPRAGRSALLTSRRCARRSCTVSSMPCCTDGASRTSIHNVITRRPSGSSRAAAARGAAWRPVITTVAPRRNSSAAIASRIPVEAPVTSAMFEILHNRSPATLNLRGTG